MIAYPNELLEPTLWQPVMVSYALLAGIGSGLLVLASLSYITKTSWRITPFLLILGVSAFSTVLLGPLADMWNPSNVFDMLVHPNIFSTEANPRIALIALYATVFYPILLISSVLFLISYNFYQERLRSIMVVLAILTLVFGVFWMLYPYVLFTFQTNNFIWRSWTLLPVISFIESLIAASAVAIIVYYIVKLGKPELEPITPLSRVMVFTSIPTAGILLLQVAYWYLVYGGSQFYLFFNAVKPLTYIVIILLLATFILSIPRSPQLTVIAAIAALLAVILDKWNVIINAQAVSKTGLATLGMHFHEGWLLTAISPIAGAILVFIILSWILPLEARGVEGVGRSG